MAPEPQTVTALDRAAELSASGRGAEALVLVRGLVRSDWPRTAPAAAVARAARLEAELGSVDDAIALVEARLEACGLDPELAVLAARWHARAALAGSSGGRLARLRAAEAHLRSALEQSPADPGAHALLGLVAERQGRAAEAVEAWRCAFVLAPTRLEHRNGLAMALCAAGRPREAVSHFEAVARARPSRADGFVNLGLALRESGELLRAVEAFEAAARLDPASARIHVELGLALRHLGRVESALAAFDFAHELDPARADALHHKGRLLLREGRIADAREVIEAARSLAPDDADIRRTVLELARTPSGEDEDTVAIRDRAPPVLVADLARFPVPEIIEFLGLGRRTGLLEVRAPALWGQLELIEGRLLSGRLEGGPSFAARLVEALVPLPQGLPDLEVGEGAGTLIALMLDEGLADRTVLERLCFDSSLETLSSLLELREGRAEFRSGGAPGRDGRLGGLAAEAQGVLLEAFRLFDEAGRF